MQTSIVTVAVYPATANTLYIRSITLGPPPSYYYELQSVDVVTKEREVPNPAYVPESTDADGNVSMTEAQWNAWPADADDDKVQLDAISANLGLTRA